MINQTNKISFVLDETRRIIIMSFLITFAVPALICFLMIFYYFIQLCKTLLFNCLNHHTILCTCILISNFVLIITELPFSLHQLVYGYVKPITFCRFWIYWEYRLDMTSLFLTMYASIEFYLLIFHQQRFIKQKIFFHYILLLFSCLFNLCLYMYLVIFFPCIQNYQYDLTDFICGGSCFFHNIVLKTFITIIDTIIPCFILFY